MLYFSKQKKVKHGGIQRREIFFSSSHFISITVLVETQEKEKHSD